MSHDEVRERLTIFGLREDLQRHPGAVGAMLDPDDLGAQVQGRLTRDLEVDLGLGAGAEPLGRPEKQAAAGQILDQPVDDDARTASALGSDGDWDPHCFPLVHVGKRTLPTHVQRINSSAFLTLAISYVADLT